jgi:hypothetical protein
MVTARLYGWPSGQATRTVEHIVIAPDTGSILWGDPGRTSGCGDRLLGRGMVALKREVQ